MTMHALQQRLLPFAVAMVSALGVIMLAMGQRNVHLAAIALVAIAGSLVLTDLKGWVKLNRTLANVAAVVAVGLSVRDFMQFDRDTQLLAIANLLIYLQIVLLFQPKFIRVYWQILVLSLLQVVVGAALNLGVMFGLLLVIYLFLMLAALMLLFVRGETMLAALPDEQTTRTAGGSRLRSTPSRLPTGSIEVLASPTDQAARLLEAGLVRQSAWGGCVTLAVTTILFFSIPRFGDTVWQPASYALTRTVGFSSSVSLGTLGAVADNTDVVMRVEFRHANKPDEPYLIYGDPLFRGSVLTHYARGQWHHGTRGRGYRLGPIPDKPPLVEGVLQRITIEPLDEPVLFGVFPMYKVHNSQRLPVKYDPARRRFLRSDEAMPSQFTFETLTTGFRLGRQHSITPETRILGEAEHRAEFVQLLQLPYTNSVTRLDLDLAQSRQRRDEVQPLDDLPELAATAQREISRAAIDAADPYFKLKAARALERYFHAPPFAYSLEPETRDPAIDPVEDFIKNNPRGDCEYFASALALMLRTQGIPSRIVVGFKAGDYNEVGNFYQIQQLHAHAWVEAYLAPGEIPPAERPDGFPADTTAGWLTLDPTPTADDDASFSGRGLLNTIADIGDYLQHLWSSYVLGLNAQRQRESFYEPLTRVTWRDGWRQVSQAGKDLFTGSWRWLSGDAFTFRGAAYLFGVVTALALAVRGACRVIGAWRRRSASRSRGRKPPRQVAFYERLERILAQQGIKRGPRQTPLEFALIAGAELVAHTDTRLHATLPRRIVEAYYRVRFGGHTLDAREADVVEQQLVTLGQVLAGRKRNGDYSRKDARVKHE
jgi:transglutaminase-like putative cysteine protease